MRISLETARLLASLGDINAYDALIDRRAQIQHIGTEIAIYSFDGGYLEAVEIDA